MKLFCSYRAHTSKRSRESVNIEQGVSTDEMLRACLEHVRFSANQRKRTPCETKWEPTSVSNMASFPNDWRCYYGNKTAKLPKKFTGLEGCCGRAVNRVPVHKQGSTLAVFRYPEHPRFSDGIPNSPEQ